MWADFIWFLRNLLILKTADEAEELLDMSEDNLKQLREDAALADENVLMRYIRVFSEVLNQIRFAAQKRVLVELAFIRLTKPEMEQSMDAVLERLERLERQMEEGIPAAPWPGNMAGDGSQPALPQAVQPQAPSLESREAEPRTVTLPKAQLEDLNLIRNEWGKIVREMGMSIRPSFRETVVEPAGDSCLCIVFSDAMNFSMGEPPQHPWGSGAPCGAGLREIHLF